MNIQKPFYIVSVFQDKLNLWENMHNMTNARDILDGRGYDYLVVEGKYKNKMELSFIVFDSAIAFELGSLFNQESIFAVDANGQAYLIAPAGEHLSELGKLQISKTLPPYLENYTKTAFGYLFVEA